MNLSSAGAKQRSGALPLTQRNRSEGWSHAKRTGHNLECEIASELRCNLGFSSKLHERLFGETAGSLPEVEVGGSDASPVPSVLEGKTPSKSDLCVRWDSDRVARISLKKSDQGQVWLVSAERFFSGFEAHFGEAVPVSVQLGLRLFIGPIEMEEMRRVLGGSRPKGPCDRRGEFQEYRQRRFVSYSLEAFEPESWKATLRWLGIEMPRITELCFARGLCSDHTGIAEFVWYPLACIATGERFGFDIFPIDHLIRAVSLVPLQHRAIPGPTRGGSTVLMPFGSLQMHRPSGKNQLQFRHSRDALVEIVRSAAPE